MVQGNRSSQAKLNVLEAPDTTWKVLLLLFTTLATLFGMLVLSYLGSGSSWICEVDNDDPKHNYICSELRLATSCRTLSGPVQAEIILDIDGEAQASALVACPWENAISELRLCFVLASMFIVMVGLLALSNESRKQAELHYNAAWFFAVMLMISSSFDLFAVNDSSTNNSSLCTYTDAFQSNEGDTGESLACSYALFTFTAYAGYATAALLLYTAIQMKIWRSSLSPDGL